MEAGANFEQTADAAPHPDTAGRGSGDAGEDLEEGRLAGPVTADDAEDFPGAHLEADMAQGVGQRVTQSAIGADPVTPVAFREPFGPNDGLRHCPQITSAKMSSMCWKYISPPLRMIATTPAAAAQAAADGPALPVSAWRKPSITTAIGLSSYAHRHRAGTSQLG